MQTIQVDRATLNQILISVNNKPQGVAREINPEMFMAILPQVHYFMEIVRLSEVTQLCLEIKQ